MSWGGLPRVVFRFVYGVPFSAGSSVVSSYLCGLVFSSRVYLTRSELTIRISKQPSARWLRRKAWGVLKLQILTLIHEA
jgi:hypothetical protein